MAKPSTFSLKIPRSSRVHVYQVRLADGSVVTRTEDQLTAPTAPTGGPTHG